MTPVCALSKKSVPTFKKLIWLYYGFQFFFTMLFWLPIFYEYQKRFGLNDTEIFQIQSWYYIAFCLLEIPTGSIADRLGYVRCLRWGALTLILANLFPIYLPTYTGFLLHFLVIALSRSFISGASNAYLYEYLKTHGNSAVFKQIEGNARAYSLVGKVFGWSAIGLLLEWHLTLPYWLTVVSAFISLVFAWKLPPIIPSKTQTKYSLYSIRSMLVSSPFLVLVMFQGIAIFVLARICQVNLFQPILESKSIGVAWFGVVMSVMTLFEALGSARPHYILSLLHHVKAYILSLLHWNISHLHPVNVRAVKAPGLRKKYTDWNVVFILTAIMALTLGLIPFLGSRGALFCLCVFALATGFSYPIQRQLLNDTIPSSQYRATLISVESIIDRLVCAVVASGMAHFLSKGKLNEFLILSCVITCVFILLLMVCTKFFKTHAVGEKT